jgi:predicted urease superfamily metal-dependent hydrolase
MQNKDDRFEARKREYDMVVAKAPDVFAPHDLLDLIQDSDVFTPKQIAELVNKDVETVRRWCRSGKLATIGGLGHYKVSGRELKRFLYATLR